MSEVVAKIHTDDDGSLWAEVDGMPGCLASGRTMDELLEALQESVALYLTDGDGPLVPVPAFRLVTNVTVPAG
jgi:predicted RNase H-like HicB family nuclease